MKRLAGEMGRLVETVGKRFRSYIERAGVRGRACEQPNLLEVLSHAPVEAAAVLLQVHPFVIDELRLRLASGELVLPPRLASGPRPRRCSRARP